jgi:hypothetical protein
MLYSLFYREQEHHESGSNVQEILALNWLQHRVIRDTRVSRVGTKADSSFNSCRIGEFCMI